MARKIARGQRFGNWKLRKFLGEGGNGFVWLALNSRNEEAAIKILAKLDGKNKAKVHARFKSEVNVVRANTDIEGLLPIISRPQCLSTG
jgi:serine/threonine protein kinase